MLLLAVLSFVAGAAEPHVVREGDTVASIAAALGDPALADDVRTRNGLGPAEEPPIGAVLDLPPRAGGVDQPAQLLALTGTATVASLGASAAPTAVGAFLPPGAELCTGDDSYATVRLASIPGCAEEDDVTLLPGTCLAIDGNHTRPDRRTSVVSVRQGAIAIRESGGGARVAVRTPAGITTGERGGFRVAVEEAATRTEAVTGDVAVLAQGTETDVPTGFGVRTPDGETPGELVELLVGEGLARPEAGTRLVVPDFAWTPTERALGYRVELATDPDFTRLVRRSEVGAPRWEPAQLFLPYQQGHLWWRAVPFDRLGFEGRPSPGRKMLFPRGVGAAAKVPARD